MEPLEEVLNDKQIKKGIEYVKYYLHKWNFRFNPNEIHGFIVLALFNLYTRYQNNKKNRGVISYILSKLAKESDNIILKEEGYKWQPKLNKRISIFDRLESIPFEEQSSEIELKENLNWYNIFKKAKLSEYECNIIIFRFNLDLPPERTDNEWSIDDLAIYFQKTSYMIRKDLNIAINKIKGILSV